MRARILVLVAVLSLAGTGAATAGSAAQAKLSGTWLGQYGGAASGTFTLRWTQTGSRLHGRISLSNPKGSYSVSGSLHGKAITFGAVGVGATYTGSVSGASMSGHYRIPGGGGTWSAHKKVRP